VFASSRRELSRPRALRWLTDRPLLSLCLLAGLLSFVGIGNEIWSPDEPRVAAMGRTMWSTGSWALPRLNGEPWLEKPPLYWWSQTLVFELFGRASAPLARLPSAIFAFGTALLTYALGRRYFAPEACFLAGLILLTISEFSLAAHWILVDNALFLSVTGTLVCFAYAEGRRGAVRALFLAGMYLFAAAAFFSKGVIGVGIPALGALVYLIWTGRLRAFWGWHLVWGGAFIVALAALWLRAVWLEAGDAALENFLVEQQLGRFFSDQLDYGGGHREPFWYYLLNGPGDWMPWTPFALLAAVSARRNWSATSDRQRDGIRFCVATVVSVLVVLSLSGTKRGLYLLPICPPLALFVGNWMVSRGRRARWEERLEGAWIDLLGVGVAACAAAPLFYLAGWPSILWGLALLAAGAYLVWVPRTAGREARLASAAVLTCLAVTNLFVCLKPMLDVSKSYLPVARDIARWIPPDRPVYVVGRETVSSKTLGLVNFYLERTVTPIRPDQLQQLVDEGGPVNIVVGDRLGSGGYTSAVESTGVPFEILSERIVDHRLVYRVLAIGESRVAPAGSLGESGG
jgi:4-amino-4-deoxy-L-arabinose transferase-like glycosyltransferase